MPVDCVGVSSANDEEAMEPMVRLRLRTVTVDGTAPPMTDERGDALGGVLTGAGSLERADCTRASRRCICAVRDRIWVSEVEVGSLWEVARFVVVRAGAGVRVWVAARVPGGRIDELDEVDELRARGFGVVL